MYSIPLLVYFRESVSNSVSNTVFDGVFSVKKTENRFDTESSVGIPPLRVKKSIDTNISQMYILKL